MSESPPILRPKPQRMWTTSPPDSPDPTQPSHTEDLPPEPMTPSLSLTGSRSPSTFSAPRTRSVLNLTASTLAGIYAPDDDSYSSLFGVSSVLPSGATTPRYPYGPSPNSPPYSDLDRATDRMAPVIGALEQPQFRRTPTALKTTRPTYTKIGRGLVRALVLFGLGAAYGALVTHLHDQRNLAPVRIDGLRRGHYGYTLFWGLAGILLGTALPIVDAIWEGEGPEERRERTIREWEGKVLGQGMPGDGKRGAVGASGNDSQSPLTEGIGLGAEWNPMVRSIGAFVGIGFAIRRLPWESTLQASATLSLVNPCLWYMIDRTVPGFALAAAVGLMGTSVLLGTNVVPMPDVRSVPVQVNGSVAGVGEGMGKVGGIEQGTLAVWVWIASVLFCSTVCFGNIGRRLAAGMGAR